MLTKTQEFNFTDLIKSTYQQNQEYYPLPQNP